MALFKSKHEEGIPSLRIDGVERGKAFANKKNGSRVEITLANLKRHYLPMDDDARRILKGEK